MLRSGRLSARGHGKDRPMAPISAPPLALSQVGRAAHDIGLAGLLGGNLFGRLALHPSVSAISDRSQRGKVVNAAWRRYGVINSVSLAAVISGWLGARLDEAANGRLTPHERRLARAKDVLVGIAGVTGVATAAQGIAFSRTAPDGAVPLADGEHAAPEASERSKRAKRRVNALGLASLAADTALVVVNAALEQRQHRRPPLRRRIPFWGRT
jgi:uncharacterized membrane protein